MFRQKTSSPMAFVVVTVERLVCWRISIYTGHFLFLLSESTSSPGNKAYKLRQTRVFNFGPPLCPLTARYSHSSSSLSLNAALEHL
jgi:hypothetical protein